ncbi:MAG: 2-hydroxyacid dehydrogenase [Paenibacillus sp.]|nr:2-hydroxyacid dehydrogenase [Paenibacillus sp.]
MGKIVCIRKLTEQDRKRVQEIAPGYEIVQTSPDTLAGHLPDAEIILGWSRSVIDGCLVAGTKLKWVQNWGAGVDKFPIQRLADCGVTLTTASGVHANPISETIFAMMLAFSRNVHQAIRNQEKKVWGVKTGMNEVHGATIGIVGVGAIGEEVARLAKAFGMTVLGVRRSGGQSPHVDRMYDSSGLDDVLAESDYLVVTVPSTEETRHMFGEPQFAKMKPSAIFINIGRGATTDTEALIAALRNGTIAGAGLDVFEQEPLPATSPLWDMDNVIMTPHNSGATVHYDSRGMDIFIANLKHYIETGRPKQNVVDYSRQY